MRQSPNSGDDRSVRENHSDRGSHRPQPPAVPAHVTVRTEQDATAKAKAYAAHIEQLGKPRSLLPLHAETPIKSEMVVAPPPVVDLALGGERETRLRYPRQMALETL